jgi:penicillin-binding protein 1A
MAENRITFYAWYIRKYVGTIYCRIDDYIRNIGKSHPTRSCIGRYASGLLNISLIIGVMLVATAVPALREFNENVLHKQQLSVAFYDRNGELIGRRGIRSDDSMKLDDYPKYFIDAVLATEDRRFYSHFGIDIVGTARAIANNHKGEKIQGGSSITQQLAKNLFLSNERTFDRKIREAFLALALEWNLSKEEILKLYLDRAYMGGGSYGAAEASRHYFNKSARNLSVSEAAILAGLFKAPSRFSPEANPEESRKRWLTVLDNLRNTRSITDQQFEEAMLYPPTANVFNDSTAANYYLDWAWEEVKRLDAAGKLGTGKNFKVTTALDLKTQRYAEEVMTKQLEEAEDKFDVEQVAMVIMNTDGAVVSMIGGNDYRESSFNRATKALRQPGSSFKPYVYATAIDAGILDKDTIVTDKPTCIGNWCPKNYSGGFKGSMPAWSAMAQSINTIPVQLSIQLGKDASSVKVGRAKIIDMTKRMGVKSELYDTQSLPIGSVELTALDQAVGYNTFASGGFKVTPYAIVNIKSTSGELIYQNEISSERVLSDRVVNNMNFMLNKVVEAGTATSAKIPGQVVAGKTGTTNAYRDAWFVGYTGSMVASIWMGNDDNSSSKQMTGGSLPARTWKMVMEQALKTQPVKAPPGIVPPPAPKTPTIAKPAKPATVADAPKQFEPPVVKERNFLERLFGINE